MTALAETQAHSGDVSGARFTAVLGVTAVLFFLCLLPFELIPEIPVDIDSKPFFVPLALCALLPSGRIGLAIGLGVALGEGLRDLMEGYELDDPIGFFGYIAGFWAASALYSVTAASRWSLVVGAVLCAAIQAAIEASSFLIFGAEGWTITVESAIGNTITHGVIWGAAPLLFLVPALEGKFESYLGFAPRSRRSAPPLPVERSHFEPDAGAVAWVKDAFFRYPGAEAPALNGVCLEVAPGEVVGLSGPPDSAKSTLALVLSGLAPSVTGGDFSGEAGAPESVAIVSAKARDFLTQARPVHEVAASYLSHGGAPADAERRARAALEAVGLPADKHDAYVWTLTREDQARTVLAAATARAPRLLVIDDAEAALGPDAETMVEGAIAALPEGSGVLLIQRDPERLRALADRIVALDEGRLSAEGAEAQPEPLAPSQPAADSAPAGEDYGPVSVPTLQVRRDGWWARRDPRVKWAIFFGLILFIYIAPDWRWMAATTAVGVVMALTARPSPGWLAFSLLVQVPNVLGLVLLPLLGGGATSEEELAFGLRLGLGWVAAILFGISLLSSMEIPEMVAGLRGLGLPKRFSFVIGYSFLLIYLSLADFAGFLRSLRVSGEALSLQRPFRLARSAATLFVPVIATVARRGGAMAVALEAGQSARVRSPFQLKRPDGYDFLLALAVAAALIAAVGARIGLL
ncbi:MAG: ATP-binding cassette domain-containing protein [Pseudomonadota bacterium]